MFAGKHLVLPSREICKHKLENKSALGSDGQIMKYKICARLVVFIVQMIGVRHTGSY